MSEKAILFTNKATGEKTLVHAKNKARASGRVLHDLYEVSTPTAAQAIKLVQDGVTVLFDEDSASDTKGDDQAAANG